MIEGWLGGASWFFGLECAGVMCEDLGVRDFFVNGRQLHRLQSPRVTRKVHIVGHA